MKSQKGITLIALVITIIVMLILVGVTITLATGGGLFDKASEAATRTDKAVKDEQALASGIVKTENGSESIEQIVQRYTSPNN